jgi:poly(glycerol-phosphate) alpha-glucosyltransferase
MTGRLFQVMWSAPEHFGGLTSMCLYRAQLFDELGNVESTILTFDVNPQYESVAATLRSTGQLSARTRLLNIYEYYRSAASYTYDAPALPAPEIWHNRFREGVLSSAQQDNDGGIYCVDNVTASDPATYVRELYRTDGSIFAEINACGDGQTLISLYNSGGDVVEQHRSEEEWCREWVTKLAGEAPSTIIVDHGRASRFLAALKQSNIVKVAIFHSNHIVKGADPLTGELGPARRHLLERPHEWDALVFLTDQQRKDVIRRFGDTGNLFTISNPRSRSPELPGGPHPGANRGIMVARLVRVKHIRAAIDIIDAARQQIPDIVLDIYGEGPRRDALERLILDKGLAGHIVLHGHLVHAAEQFRHATFSLLTSRHEAQSLAIMESQAQGCPPVAFDVRYGPGDLIQNGMNGYLTQFGDISGAAQRVVEICKDPALRERLSEEAWKSSERFAPSSIFEAWQEMLSTVWARREELRAGQRATSGNRT